MMSVPSTLMRPLSKGTSPLIAFISVDFPAPFGHINATVSPALTDNETPATDLNPPYEHSTS